MRNATFHLARRAAAAVGFGLVVIPLSVAQSGYAVGDSSNPGPVRMARFSYVNSGVRYRPTPSVGWSTAAINTPIRQGAEIWAKNSSRSETQFDDGSVLRLGTGGIATLATMYSDSNGEFTELKVTNGLATLHIKSKLSEFQVDTPQASVKAHGPATIRVGINGNICEIADQSGEAEVNSGGGTKTLNAGQLIDYRTPAVAGESVRRVPAPDNWDKWSSERDTAIYHENRYLPPDENLVAGDLDSYGTWRDDPKYGHVWYPHEASADWRPYRDGSWTWVAPFGWTWTGREDWGWAPYHYGTWYHASYGWGWCPGPENQYWSPAVVDFCDDGENVAWAPLAPWEVQYPAALSIGFSGGDWGLSFSIGQAGCYYPGAGDFCVGRPWANSFANVGYGYYDPGYVNNYYAEISLGSSGFYGQSRFRPYNAYHANGAVMASYSTFGRGGNYRGLAANQAANVFTRGRSYTGAPRGAQVSGPLGARPTMASYTPSHSFTHGGPPANVAQRSVYRAPIRGNIARQAGNPGRVVNASNGRQGAANGRMANNAGRPNAALRTNAAMGTNRVANNNAFTHRQTTSTRNAMAVAHGNAAAAHAGAGRANGRSIAAAAHNARATSTMNHGRAVSTAVHNARAATATHGRSVSAATHGRSGSAAVHARAATATHGRAGSAAVHTRTFGGGTHAAVRTHASRPATRTMPSSPRRSSSNFRSTPRSFGGGGMSRPAPRSFGGGGMSRPAPRSFGGGGMSRPAPRSFGGGGGGISRPASRPSAPRGGGSGGGNRRHP